MSKTLRRILAVSSKHALCNDSKWHVTPISANHFSIFFETVPNAPIMIGTTVTLGNFQIPLSLLLLLLLLLLLQLLFACTCTIAHMWNQLPTMNKSSTTLGQFHPHLFDDKFTGCQCINCLQFYRFTFCVPLGPVYIFNILISYFVNSLF